MTDKQIMIDGVDVSKCRYFCRYDDLCRDDNIGRVVRPLCKRMPDCYFKQLARKTQECEELKKANQHIDTNRQCKGSKLKRIEELISDCETGYTDEFIQKIYGIIQEPEPTVNDYSITDRYRKALEEIEEYINNQGINHKWNMYIQRFRQKILDIIDKAKGKE